MDDFVHFNVCELASPLPPIMFEKIGVSWKISQQEELIMYRVVAMTSIQLKLTLNFFLTEDRKLQLTLKIFECSREIGTL